MSQEPIQNMVWLFEALRFIEVRGLRVEFDKWCVDNKEKNLEEINILARRNNK